MKKTKFIISNFNKHLIVIISLLFIYLFYLSIPSLYDKGKLQKDLTSKILEEFKINLSVSSEISYRILPSPHIVITNAKLFNDDLENPKEISQIKKLNIFISQKHFLDQNNLVIRKILIEDANFSFQEVDFKFLKKLFGKKISNKKILIKKSNFFFKDKNNKTISIFPIFKINLFYDEKKLVNNIGVTGEVFKIPFSIKWIKNFKNKINTVTVLKLKKLRLKIKNVSSNENGIYLGNNTLIVGNNKLLSNYKIENDIITVLSQDTNLINNNMNYKAKINTSPFYLKLDINLNKIDINKFLDTNSIFFELLKSNILFSRNLNAEISITSEDIIKNKLFNSSKILINFNNEKINFNNSYLKSKKIGLLKLYFSSLEFINKELVFKGHFNFNINKQDEFYRIFQIPKKIRKPVKNIFFDIELNLFSNEIKINGIYLNNLKKEIDNSLVDILAEYNNDNNKINNWIDLKNFMKKVFKNYSG